MYYIYISILLCMERANIALSENTFVVRSTNIWNCLSEIIEAAPPINYFILHCRATVIVEARTW